MGRKRIYANNAERQRAFRERKQKQKLIEEIERRKLIPEVYPTPSAYFFKKYTLEQVKKAYTEYKRINAEHGYDITLAGDYDYEGKRPLNLCNEEIILDRESNITYTEMEGFIDNFYWWTCYYCNIRNSVFEAKCGKCHRKREPNQRSIEKLYHEYNNLRKSEVIVDHVQ